MTPGRHLRKYEPPMIFDVVVSSRAATEINTTITYFEDVCHNRSYAKTFYEEVKHVILELETKENFHIRDQEMSKLLGRDVYRIRLGRYRLLYQIDRSKGLVTVFSFFHEAQNLEPLVASDYSNQN